MQGLRIVLTMHTKDTLSTVAQCVCVPYTDIYRCIHSAMRAFVKARGQSWTWFLTKPGVPQLI